MTIDLNFEKKLKDKHGYLYIAGLDEVGRGPLAGPVTVGAFVFYTDLTAELKLLRDSKLLSEKQRKSLYENFKQLKKEGKVDFATSSCFPSTIDKKQIHHASVLAMRRAVKKLDKNPDFAIIDKFPYRGEVLRDVSYRGIRRADNLVPSVAAASIVAKVKRDRSMATYYHKKYPQYRFDLHKGYGTELHYKMLKKHGPSPIHRKSFRLS
ncbi:MAG: ribonuclease HII [Candidatus Spechtbacterales bacterium]|nr:ribonuclease HII [Candidatus Spechtbacterales bacterium]